MKTLPVCPDLKRKSFSPVFYFFAAAAVLGLILFLAGLTTPPSLGDEIHHFRFAKNCFAAGGRALFDAIYESSNPPGFYYDTEAAWPLVLSWIWRGLGRVSVAAAQFYQTLYYILLVTGTYRAARFRFDQNTGFVSGLLVATLPMIVSFSMLFYLDVPAASLAIWIFCFLQERRYLGAGILLGFAYMLKKSTVFFMPMLFLWELKRSWRKPGSCALRFLKICLPAFLLVLWDERWRRHHFLHQQVISSVEWVKNRLEVFLDPRAVSMAGRNLTHEQALREGMATIGRQLKASLNAADYSNSSIFNFLDILKYFGIPFFAGFLLYFSFRQWNRKDAILWGLVLGFLVEAFLLHLFPDIRYLIPLAPFLCILAARGLLQGIKYRWVRVLIGVTCLLQFFSVLIFTREQRVIPEEIQQGFAYLRTETPKTALMLYPETNLIEYAERRMVWTRMNLRALFWGTEAEKAEQILRFKLDYIVVKKKRVYDDTKAAILHVGKYPVTFLKALSIEPYVLKVFENSEMAVYAIDRQQLQAAYAA